MFPSYVQAGYPLLYIQSYEEGRVLLECTSALAEESPDHKVYTWDLVNGVRKIYVEDGELMVNSTVETVPDTTTPVENGAERAMLSTEADPLAPLQWLDLVAADDTVLFLKDYHYFLDKDGDFKDRELLIRTIRNLIEKFKSQGKMLVILSPVTVIPPALDKDVTVIDYKLPDKGVIQKVLEDLCPAIGADVPEDSSKIVRSAMGLTVSEAENLLALSYQKTAGFDSTLIMHEKAKVVKKTDILELFESNVNINDVGGAEILKAYLSVEQGCFGERAAEFGIRPSRGLLLFGVSGCGKSLLIKAIASMFNRPLLRMDMGRIMNSLLGESEHRLIRALDIAAALAPVVLWIDEGEKQIDNGKGVNTHEVSKKMNGILLNFMQENLADIFFGMTANSVDGFPPELLRCGRIDAKFWVDLPDAVQRAEILGIHLRQVKRTIDSINPKLQEVVTACQGFSGAELNAWLQLALRSAFLADRELNADDYLSTIDKIVPVSRYAKDSIAADRRWAVTRGIPNASASHSEDTPVSQPAAKSRKVTTRR